MTIARRAFVTLMALAGLALAVSGAWVAVVLGPSGTARFTATATGPVVVGPDVLGRVDVPVTVRAMSGDAPVFLGAALPQDVVDVVGGARAQQAVTVRFPARTLALRASGSGDLADPRALEVWRATGVGSIDIKVADAPESVLVVPTTNAPVRVTVELRRGAWFLEAVVALVVGLIVAVAAIAWLVQQIGHRIPMGPLARRDRRGAQPPPPRATFPSQGFDEDDEDDEQPDHPEHSQHPGRVEHLEQGEGSADHPHADPDRARMGPPVTARLRAALIIVVATVLTGSLAGCGALVGLAPAPTGVVGGAVGASMAQAIATRVVAAAVKADATPTAAGDAARRVVYSGDALSAATADARLAVTADTATTSERALTAAPPVVLAVSRGLTYPRTMVVQTTRARSGLPVLYLLSTPDVRTAYRIAASAPMLPGASVKSFDPLAQGSEPIGSGAGLAVTPTALTASYAASLAFPAATGTTGAPVVAGDSFARGVRANAAAQNTGMNGIGSFTQVHTAKDVVGGLRVAGQAGALVFVALDRRDAFLNRTTGVLTPSKQFTALTGLKTVTSEARLSTLELVVFFVPDTGSAVTVAAQEHLYAASGI